MKIHFCVTGAFETELPLCKQSFFADGYAGAAVNKSKPRNSSYCCDTNTHSLNTTSSNVIEKLILWCAALYLLAPAAAKVVPDDACARQFQCKKEGWMDGIWVPQNEYLSARRGTQIIIHALATI